MTDPKKGYLNRKIHAIALLLIFLSVNAACSLQSQVEVNGTSDEEIGPQWNIFGSETDISLLIPDDDDLFLAYHPPCVRIREPQNGMIFTADDTGFANIQIHITSSDQAASIAIYDNGTQIGSVNCPCPITFDFKAGVGMHTFTAKAAGSDCYSSPVTIIVNPSEPSVEITAPINGQLYSAPSKIEIHTNVLSEHAITKVEFFANSQRLGEDTTGPAYGFDWTNIQTGVYRLTAKATDDQGHAAISNYVLVVIVPEKPLAKADLGLTMSASPSPALIGGNLNYVLTLTNFGPSRANDIVLTDFLPGGLNSVSSKATQGQYDINMGEWKVGSLDPYRSARLTIFTEVPTGMNPGWIYNEATVAGAERDQDTSNNYARVNTLLIRRI
ncbi:MAG: Ig-like domain-containing protein [Methanothrix sp.]